MEDTTDRQHHRGESPLPFESLDQQFRDWVIWLHGVESPFTASQVTRAPGRQGKADTPSFEPGSQREDGWRWQDVGGESGETVCRQRSDGGVDGDVPILTP